MSHNNSILSLLNLKDTNIVFDDTIFCSEETMKNITYKFFNGTLTYTPGLCLCGHVFDDNIVNMVLKLQILNCLMFLDFTPIWDLKTETFCKHCNSTFILKTSIVDKNCFISNNTKLAIALNAKDKISEKDIAKNHNVSHSTVNRVIDSFYAYHKPNYNYLPKHLCFDEFKSVKSAKGAMSFIFCDSETGRILDIVEDRGCCSNDYFYDILKQLEIQLKQLLLYI